MKVVLAGAYDHAAICTRLAEALRSVGVQAHALQRGVPNPYRFPVDIRKDYWDKVLRPDWVEDGGMWVGLCDRKAPLSGDMAWAKGKRAFTLHLGSDFRAMSALYTSFAHEYGARFSLLGLDLYRLRDLRMPSYPFVVPHWPAQLPASSPTVERPLKVSHSPSSRVKKGTERILEVLRAFVARGDIELDLIEGAPHNLCLLRRAQSVVFVDQMVPHIAGLGVAATEALAQGCVVISDISYSIEGFRAMGVPVPPVLQAKTPDVLERHLTALCREPAQISTLRTESLAWSTQHSSLEAVGLYLKGLMEKHG